MTTHSNVVEAIDWEGSLWECIAHLQAFLKPGAGVTLCEITPVSDRPVAPNK